MLGEREPHQREPSGKRIWSSFIVLVGFRLRCLSVELLCSIRGGFGRLLKNNSSEALLPRHHDRSVFHRTATYADLPLAAASRQEHGNDWVSEEAGKDIFYAWRWRWRHIWEASYDRKQQKTALNMAKFIQSSLCSCWSLTSLISMSRADLCEKLHDDADIFSVHCPRDWMHYRMVADGQSVVVRLPDWRVRVEQHCTGLIKTKFDLSTCSGEAQCKNGRYFRAFTCLWSLWATEGWTHHSGQVSEQRDTASADQSEQVIRHLKRRLTPEHLLFVRIRTLTAWNGPCSFLKITEQVTESPDHGGNSGKNLTPSYDFLSGIREFLNLPKNRESRRSSPLNTHTPRKIKILKIAH